MKIIKIKIKTINIVKLGTIVFKGELKVKFTLREYYIFFTVYLIMIIIKGLAGEFEEQFIA